MSTEAEEASAFRPGSNQALFLNHRDDADMNEFDAFAFAATDFAMRRMERKLRVPPVKPKREPLFVIRGFWKRVWSR